VSTPTDVHFIGYLLKNFFQVHARQDTTGLRLVVRNVEKILIVMMELYLVLVVLMECSLLPDLHQKKNVFMVKVQHYKR
jgi:hypothetical protein